MSGDPRSAARAWLALDPDPETRAETEALLAADDAVPLEDRFGARLAFGTAGLRGALGAGPNRMNRLVVMQTTAGLARFLAGRTAHPTAVVGYDARRNSARFARDTAEVLAAHGVAVTLLPEALPTPVLAFAVRHLGQGAGVMITASHNPAADNGYKLYLGGVDAGSQLVPPDDAAVLAAIDEVVAEGRLPAASDAVTIAGPEVLDAYVAATAAVAGDAPGAPRWVYTPMHGVGLATVRRVLEAAGLPQPVVVPEQAHPDPAFPTAPFPNPEEPGTLDLALALAETERAALVIANDPDADRMALAVRDGRGLRRLTGNETGLLLGWSLAAGAGESGGMLAASIVSTPGLARIADRFGFGYAETLTGFKWISRVPALLFGFEEALGHLVDAEVVRDKDGISALVAVLALAGRLQAEGRTIADLLAEIEAAIGRYDSRQVSVRVAGSTALVDAVRADPPAAIGGRAVLGIDDLLHPVDGLPPTDALRVRLDGARVIVRPSGTEPKLKVYLDAWSDDADAASRRRATDATLDDLERGVHTLLEAARDRVS